MGEKILNKLDPQICYDERTDVLYISFGEPRPGISAEVNDGDLVRLDLYTNEIIGITIIDFKNRYMLGTFSSAVLSAATIGYT